MTDNRRRILSLALLCLASALLYSAEWSGKSYYPAAAGNCAVLASEAFNVVAYLACAVLCRRLEHAFLMPGRAQVAGFAVVGIGAASGRALLALSDTQALGIPALIGIALHSIGEPILLMACLCMLCRDRQRGAAVVLPCAFLVSGLAMTIQNVANIHLGNAFVIAGPVLAAACILGSMRLGASGPQLASQPEGGRPSARMPLWPFVLMVAYDLTYHLIITVDTATSSYGMLGLVAISAVAALLAAAKGSDYSPLPLNKVALPCVIVALMCLTLPAPGPDVAALLSNTGSAAFYLFALITFIMMCQRHEFRPARSLGAFLAIEHVGHLAGDLAGQLFNQAFPAGGAALQLFATCIAAGMVTVATVFFNDLDVARIFGLVPEGVYSRKAVKAPAGAGPRDDTNPPAVLSVMSSRENIAWQCASMAREHGLTVREQEVLELLVLDMTNAQIAEAMVVSPGTVKTHVSHLCRKLGVASRSEAVELVRKA